MNTKLPLLLVAATPMELQLILTELQQVVKEGKLHRGFLGEQEVILVATGIGIVNTSFVMGGLLGKYTFQAAINLGIAGAYDEGLQLGEIVEIQSDSFTDMGADSAEGFLNLEKLGFPVFRSKEEIHYHTLKNPYLSGEKVRKVSGATVNTVNGVAEKIRLHKQSWDKQVESMEGAAFFHAMLQTNTPFYAFRAISNYVRERNTHDWDIPLAIKKAQLFVLNFVKEAL
ncbi:MAG: futalosine hydrolase [Bacteroidota bacterium]